MNKTMTVGLHFALSAGIILFSQGIGTAQSDNASEKQVTFRTAEKAPDDFNAWTFYWKAPSIELDAKFEYVVIQPDGKEYFKLDVSKVKEGTVCRSDFKPGFAGGDPHVFYNQNVTITFKVTKGSLVFDPNWKYFFEFRKEKRVEAVMESNDPSQTVPTPNQLTFGVGVEPNKTTTTEADILADPNKIETEIKAFEGLQGELDEFDKKGLDESRQWLQREAGNRLSLAKDNHELIMAELTFIRKLAIEEGAKKTKAAIEGLLLNRQQQFDKLNEKLQQDRREEIRELRRERGARGRRPADQRAPQERRPRGR